MEKGEIYCITNLTNGKKYVGQTIVSSLKRWNQHINEAKSTHNHSKSWALNNAIMKYGENNFNVEIIFNNIPINKLDEYEVEQIVKLNTMFPNGYNIRSGGKRGYHCDESREKMRLKKIGKNNFNYGKPRTDSTKKKISDSKKGENHHFYNKNLTDDHKLKLSKAYRKNDLDLPMYMIKINPRPEIYQSEGYAILNHPNGKNKYFTSKKITLDEKYQKALSYLNELNELTKINN